MRPKTIIFILLVVLVALLVWSSTYLLDETQQSIVTQLGKPVGKPRTTAGIHWKVPFIQKVIVFDKRLLKWDGASQEMLTKDNKFILIDTFARWRICDALVFYKCTRNEQTGYSRLDDIIDGTERDVIANYTLPEIIRSTDRQIFGIEIESNVGNDIEDSTRGFNIHGKRQEITNLVFQSVQKKLNDMNIGIEIIDLKFKRINYTKDMQEKVFNWMISEQNRIAEKYRALGQGEKQRILGRQEQKKKEILSQAYLESQTIRGKAEVRAIQIYSKSVDRSADSREFYKFYRTLEAYRAAIDTSTTLLLSTDEDFFKYLDSPR